MRGQIFSDELLNITVHNITLPGEGGASSSDITTGTIVGIAVGGALFLIGLAALIWAYCRRKKKRQAAAAADQTPPPDNSNASSFTAHSSPYFNNEKGHPSYELSENRSFATNAEYYDRLQEEVRAGRLDPRALPTHPAYNPRLTMSRNSPTPSHQRTATPDAHSLKQHYLNTVDQQRGSYHSRYSHSRSRSATPPRASHESATTGVATATTVTSYPPPPPGPPPAHSRSGSTHSGTPSISVPSVPRVKVPKQYEPPTIVVDAASPLDDEDGTKGVYTLSTQEVDPRR